MVRANISYVQALRRKGIEFVVAPFEADAQIAYLCQKGYCDLAITEDSDLIAFGCDTVCFGARVPCTVGRVYILMI